MLFFITSLKLNYSNIILTFYDFVLPVFHFIRMHDNIKLILFPLSTTRWRCYQYSLAYTIYRNGDHLNKNVAVDGSVYAGFPCFESRITQ